mgnify:CR=1 FL=1|jgi:hypothetical protein
MPEATWGIPPQLWGPGMWRVLYSLLFCAQEYIRAGGGHAALHPISFPPVRYNPAVSVESVRDAVKRIFYNLCFVLPCKPCRDHTCKWFLRPRDCSPHQAVCQQDIFTENVDIDSPLDTVKSFRDAVTKRLERERCGRECRKRPVCSMYKSEDEVIHVRIMSGIYFMSKLDVISTAWFISDSQIRRIRNGDIPYHQQNHSAFVRGMCTLLNLVGWMEPLKIDDDVTDIMSTFKCFAPPEFSAWGERMASEIKNWRP